MVVHKIIKILTFCCTTLAQFLKSNNLKFYDFFIWIMNNATNTYF